MKRTFRAGLAILAAGLVTFGLTASAADRKPLVNIAGQVQAIPATDTLQTPAASTANASVNLPHGTAPSSPANGDCWTTTAGLFCRINGATVGPMGAGGGSPGGSSGQIQYNNAGAFGGFTASGDATVNTATGAVAVSKTGGVSFATSATTDTTNAANIASGVLGSSRGGAGAVSGILKANGSGVVSAASSGTDYAPATSGSSVLYGNGSGGFSNVTIGTGLTFSTGTLSASGGSGTVTTTGGPASGNLAKFSGATSVTNGDLSGDCTTSATLAVTCTKTSGTNFGTFATQNYATPPAIGGTTPAAGAFTTLSANTSLTTNVTGSTQCVHVNASGVLSGTGTDCGSGGAGGGSGFFEPLITSIPTSASTGFTTWRNQGPATVADVLTGVSLVDFANAGGGATNLRARSKTAPGTPYTCTFLFAVNLGFAINTSQGVQVGWTDGTKYQVFNFFLGATANQFTLNVHNYSTASAFSASATTAVNGPTSNYLWMQISDDGTNVTYRYSTDGISFIPFYTVAKASGYLGSSGYSNVVFSIDARAARASAVLMFYSETSP